MKNCGKMAILCRFSKNNNLRQEVRNVLLCLTRHKEQWKIFRKIKFRPRCLQMTFQIRSRGLWRLPVWRGSSFCWTRICWRLTWRRRRRVSGRYLSHFVFFVGKPHVRCGVISAENHLPVEDATQPRQPWCSGWGPEGPGLAHDRFASRRMWVVVTILSRLLPFLCTLQTRKEAVNLRANELYFTCEWLEENVFFWCLGVRIPRK